MSGNVFRLDPTYPEAGMEPSQADLSGLISGIPNMRGHDWYVSDDGRASVGVWACDTYREHLAFPYDETFVVLEGRFTVTEPGQAPVTFGPGDVFFIRGGTEIDIDVSGPFRKLYMNYDPGAAPPSR